MYLRKYSIGLKNANNPELR